MQKWWAAKSKSVRNFIKQIIVIWSVFAVIVCLTAYNSIFAYVIFIALAILASFECYRELKLNQKEQALLAEVVRATQTMCETCPMIFMAQHGIVPSNELVVGRYKKGGRESDAISVALPTLPTTVQD